MTAEGRILLLNDIIVRLVPPDLHFDRDIYERLCSALFEYYDTQSRSRSAYRFTCEDSGGSCLIERNHFRITEFFHGREPSKVLSRVEQVAERVYRACSSKTQGILEIQMSARLSQKDLYNERRISFLSSDEYISARFLQEIDFSALEAKPRGIGLRFLFERENTMFDLRIEPFFQDRTYVFVDLGVRWDDERFPGIRERSIRQTLDECLAYFEERIPAFMNFASSAASEAQPKEDE